MKEYRVGISLIALIITIAVIIMISIVIVSKGIERTGQAQIAKHNINLSVMQEEVESYYYQSGILPTIDLTPYPIVVGSTLYNEIAKNADSSDSFYILDMKKLGKVSGKEGTGIGEDMFIVSSIKHNVYYVKGTYLKGYIYHGRINSGNSGYLASYVSPAAFNTVTPTLTPTPTSSPTPTPLPGSGYYDGTVNSPKLSAGMTAVKWNGASWVAANLDNSSNDWYDYRNTGGTANKWANAQLADGSLLVWIPRYTYQIANNEHTNAATGGTINIRFSNGTTDDTTGGYREHPAFYWGGWNIPISSAMTKVAGGVELSGIWVGKFESNNNASKVRIQSGQASWVSINISNMFGACRNMQIVYSTNYGISTNTDIIDTHMLKRSEWGAVAYLSKYALGTTEVVLNSTGITANSNIVTNKAQSSTGSEYGIFDMRGCTEEYSAAYLNNGNSYLNSNGNLLYNASVKYKDILPQGVTDSAANNYAAISQAYGFGLYETSSNANGVFGWFGDNTYYPYTSYPFLLSSGDSSAGTGAGLFYFSSYDGSTGARSFRVSVCIP